MAARAGEFGEGLLRDIEKCDPATNLRWPPAFIVSHGLRLEKGLQGTEFPQFACEKYRGGYWMLRLIETPHHKSAVDKTCDFGETHTALSQPRNQARAANINPNNRGFTGSQIQVEQLSHNGTGTPRIIDKKGCTVLLVARATYLSMEPPFLIWIT
jgi:hypothetical protein